MELEVVIVFIPIPFLIWLWNVRQMMSAPTRNVGVISFLIGIVSVLYVVLPFQSREQLIQDLTLVGVLYIPCYLILLFALTKFMVFKRRRKLRSSA